MITFILGYLIVGTVLWMICRKSMISMHMGEDRVEYADKDICVTALVIVIMPIAFVLVLPRVLHEMHKK